MDKEKLEKAVKNDTTDLLQPVLEVAYALKPVEKFKVVKIAYDINTELGYDLFDDLYYPSLIKDFAIVTQAVQINAIQNNK